MIARSACDTELQDLLHSIIDLGRKTTAKTLSQTNALLKLASLQQELNSRLTIIENLQKEAAERMSELRPLTFEAKFLNEHLHSKLMIDNTVSGSKLEEISLYVKSFMASLPKTCFKQDFDLPDFGSSHELELAKIANKYKSHDTSSLKFEIYTNIYNSELQRLEIASSQVNTLTRDIILYQHKIKEAEKIHTIYSNLLMELTKEIHNLTDWLSSLRKDRNNLKKDSQIIIMDNSDDDGYYTPDEDI